MLPGTPNIKICLDCDGLIEEKVLLSGNTFGVDFYTDGKMEAPMLPEHHALFKCQHYQSLMWSDDLQIIDSDELDEQVNVMPYLIPNFDDYLYKLKDGICVRWLEDGDKVATRYVAYDSSCCIDSPRRRRGNACEIFRRNV